MYILDFTRFLRPNTTPLLLINPTNSILVFLRAHLSTVLPCARFYHFCCQWLNDSNYLYSRHYVLVLHVFLFISCHIRLPPILNLMQSRREAVPCKRTDCGEQCHFRQTRFSKNLIKAIDLTVHPLANQVGRRNYEYSFPGTWYVVEKGLGQSSSRPAPQHKTVAQFQLVVGIVKTA